MRLSLNGRNARKTRSVLVLAVATSTWLGCDPPRPAVRSGAETAPGEEPSHAAARPMAAEPSREGWNTAQIDWQPYAAGMARARAEHKPVCLVFHADWCAHCRNYAHVFEDPRIVARARDMIMVRVNVDEAPDVASRYQIDGTYVPRTYFVSPEGATLADIDARRPQFRYFFDEHQPASLLAAMDTAVQRR